VGIGLVRIRYKILYCAVRYEVELAAGMFLFNGLVETGEQPCIESVLCDIVSYVIEHWHDLCNLRDDYHPFEGAINWYPGK